MIKNSVLALFLAVFSLSPIVGFAYDVLTKTDTQASVGDNYFMSLKADVKKWCNDEQLKILAKIDEENDRFESIHNPTLTQRGDHRDILEVLDNRLGVADRECAAAEAKLNNPVEIQSNNTALQCGPDYVKFGGQCILHTHNCEVQYGKNITGARYKEETAISACTCNSGYSFDGKQCVVKTEVKVETKTEIKVNPIPAVAQTAPKTVSTFVKSIVPAKQETKVTEPESTTTEVQATTTAVFTEIPVEYKPSLVKRFWSFIINLF